MGGWEVAGASVIILQQTFWAPFHKILTSTNITCDD